MQVSHAHYDHMNRYYENKTGNQTCQVSRISYETHSHISAHAEIISCLFSAQLYA